MYASSVFMYGRHIIVIILCFAVNCLYLDRKETVVSRLHLSHTLRSQSELFLRKPYRQALSSGPKS